MDTVDWAAGDLDPVKDGDLRDPEVLAFLELQSG